MTRDRIVRWGILGAGNIAHRFAASLQFCDDCILVAVSGRNIEKLDAFVKEYPCKPDPKDFVAIVLHSDMNEAGTFDELRFLYAAVKISEASKKPIPASRPDLK